MGGKKKDEEQDTSEYGKSVSETLREYYDEKIIFSICYNATGHAQYSSYIVNIKQFLQSSFRCLYTHTGSENRNQM